MSDIKRTEGGKFAKGVSPNPGGRPAREKEIKEAFQGYGMEALQTLVSLMRSEDQKGSVREAACRTILDRGYGKVSQPIDIPSLRPIIFPDEARDID